MMNKCYGTVILISLMIIFVIGLVLMSAGSGVIAQTHDAFTEPIENSVDQSKNDEPEIFCDPLFEFTNVDRNETAAATPPPSKRIQTIYSQNFEKLTHLNDENSGVSTQNRLCRVDSRCWKSGTGEPGFRTPMVLIPADSENVEVSWAVDPKAVRNDVRIAVEIKDKEPTLLEWSPASHGIPDSDSAEKWNTLRASLSRFSGESISIVFYSAGSDFSIDDIKITRALPETPAILVGQTLSLNERGISHAVVTLEEADGTLHTAIADSFGNFRFEEIFPGQQIVLSAENERKILPELTLQLAGETRIGWRSLK